MNSKKTARGLVPLAFAALALTACSAQETPDRQDFPETVYVPQPPSNDDTEPSSSGARRGTPPRELFCPEYGSRAARGAVRDVVIEKNQSEKVLAMGGAAKVHIKAGVTVNADVVVCGGGATLILEGAVSGRVLIGGGGPRLILANGASEPAAYWFDGGGPEVIKCPEQTPCERYF